MPRTAEPLLSPSLPRQCAWCLRVWDLDGTSGVKPHPLLPAPTTHGICPLCKVLMLAEIEITKDDLEWLVGRNDQGGPVPRGGAPRFHPRGAVARASGT